VSAKAVEEYYSIGRAGLKEHLTAQGFRKAVAVVARPPATRSQSFGSKQQRYGRLGVNVLRAF